MKYTLAQIFGALGGVENGQEMISSLQGIIEENKKTDKSGEILQKLGVNSIDELEKVVSTLDTFKKAGNDPTALTNQLTQLTKQVKELTAKYEQSEAKAKEEREKRIKTSINTQLLAALNKNNAIMPEEFAQLLAAKVTAKDDDSLVFMSDDNKEISVEDGVKAWLSARPSAVKNTLTGGAGSGTNFGSDFKNPFSREHRNLTLAGQIFKDNPAQARELAKQANFDLGGFN